MTDVTGLGHRVKELRQAHGLSQSALGGADFSASYVSLIEAGKRQPSLEALIVLAGRLGTTVDDLSRAAGGAGAPRSRAEVDLDLKWARIAIRAGNPVSAEKYARIVLDDAHLVEADRLDALSLLAAATEGQGRLVEAIGILEDLQEAIDPAVTRELWMSTQAMLMRCYKHAGDVDHAIAIGERAISAFGDVHREEEMMFVISLAAAYSERGDLTRARMLLSNVLSRAEATGSLRARGGALWNASIVAADDGRYEDAVALSERALAAFAESDAARNLGVLHANCGWLLLEQEGQQSIERARTHFQSALDEMRDEASLAERSRVLLDLARCDLIEGDIDRAEARVLEAQASIDEGDDGMGADAAFAELVQAHILVERGEGPRGLALAKQAAEVTEQQESGREASRTWMTVADLARSEGDHELLVFALDRSVRAAGVRPTKVGRTREGAVVRAREQAAAERQPSLTR